MAYDTLIVEIEDYVALIRLNRPDPEKTGRRTPAA